MGWVPVAGLHRRRSMQAGVTQRERLQVSLSLSRLPGKRFLTKLIVARALARGLRSSGACHSPTPSKRAFVDGSPTAFGMSRMSETLTELSGNESHIRVFYDFSSALSWLGLESFLESVKSEIEKDDWMA